jgi:hypothetical protein
MLKIGLITCVMLGLFEVVWYVFRTPSTRTAFYTRRTPRLAQFLYNGAHSLTLLRLPYTLLPYLTKLLLFVVLRGRFKSVWDSGGMQAARLMGDAVNFALVSLLLWSLALPVSRLVMLFITWVIWAEWLRLLAEKGQTVWSGVWQLLPHRYMAWRLMRLRHIAWVRHYCAYYVLPDADRLAYLLRVLRLSLYMHPDSAAKMAYVTQFRIVPPTHPLRQAHVRDVASGAIFIHRRWTNDPYLLLGLALRRSPWIFDPRYLRRPFFYRMEANKYMTLMVLEHATVTPPFAWYQFGHEVKAARFDMFFRLCRQVGWQVEKPVGADGEYTFDPMLKWLAGAAQPPVPLCTDEQALAAIEQSRLTLNAADIARRYTYPEKYVREVLLEKLQHAQNKIDT